MRKGRRAKASSPTRTCGTGSVPKGSGLDAGMFKLPSSKDFNKPHLFQTPPSDMRPLVPMSAYSTS